MQRIKLNSLWMWPLLAAFVAVLMSFDNPFRLALAAFMLAAQGPVWRFIHLLEPAPARAVKISR
ncbi:MAG TPA: hypothetical protein VF474_00945 [Phenylobacterium sp.]